MRRGRPLRVAAGPRPRAHRLPGARPPAGPVRVARRPAATAVRDVMTPRRDASLWRHGPSSSGPPAPTSCQPAARAPASPTRRCDAAVGAAAGQLAAGRGTRRRPGRDARRGDVVGLARGGARGRVRPAAGGAGAAVPDPRRPVRGRCGVRGGREPEGLPVERTRLRGKRSRRKRCPGCRCLRARWLPENHWHAGRVGWARLVAGGPRVCPWCQRRHADPSPG